MKSKFACILILIATFSGCAGSGQSHSASQTNSINPDITSIVHDGTRGTAIKRSYSKEDFLIFNGTGASYGEPDNLVNIVESHGKTQRTVNSAEINNMSLSEMKEYGAIIWPGGNGRQITNSLTYSTRKNIHDAVVDGGLGYISFCAGSFLAIGPAGDYSTYFSFLSTNLPDGSVELYHAPGEDSEGVAMEVIEMADGTSRDLMWYGGPDFRDLAAQTVGKTGNGLSAIAQAPAGKGFLVLVGPHPAAPQNWRTDFGLYDRDGLDYDLTWQLISAGFNHQPLPSF